MASSARPVISRRNISAAPAFAAAWAHIPLTIGQTITLCRARLFVAEAGKVRPNANDALRLNVDGSQDAGDLLGRGDVEEDCERQAQSFLRRIQFSGRRTDAVDEVAVSRFLGHPEMPVDRFLEPFGRLLELPDFVFRTAQFLGHPRATAIGPDINAVRAQRHQLAPPG